MKGGTSRWHVTVPVASCVSVHTPNCKTVQYVFSSVSKKRANWVASPRQSTKTPLASGSSVPVWPTARIPRMRRTATTTSCDVMPRGLSRLRIPLSMCSVTFRWFYGRGWNEVVQDTRDSDTIGNSGIEFEGEFWGVAQCQVFAKLAADKAGGMLKSLQGRIGKTNGIFAPAPRARAPWRSPALPASGHATPGCARAPSAARLPRRSAPEPGVERRRAAWTCGAGWGTVGVSGVPWGEGFGKGGLGMLSNGIANTQRWHARKKPTAAARTSPTSPRATAEFRRPNRTFLGENGQVQWEVGRPQA